MNGPRDDFLDALNYQVKYEVVTRYLRERRIIEEEKKEYQELLNAYRVIEAAARNCRDDLACLLVDHDNWVGFFRLLGFGRPPLARFGPEAANQPPFCPLGLRPKGITRRGRYINLVIHTYGRLVDQTHHGQTAAENLLALDKEINRDIQKFHSNFDLMAIINLLNAMDIDLVIRKKILGGNFTAEELTSIETRMMFKKLDARADGVRSWPELPPATETRRRTTKLLMEIYKREREQIAPAIR